MSLGTTAEWLGGILFCNWYLERLSISNYTGTASITDGRKKSIPRKRLDKQNFVSFPIPNLIAKYLFKLANTMGIKYLKDLVNSF